MTDHAPVPPAAPSAAPAQPAQPSQFALLRQRRFLPFFLTQFCGAFNDNLYKNALVVLFTFQAAQMTSLQPAVLVNLAGGIFILPFFLFSATCGQIADKFEKSRLIRFTKLLEIAVMGLGAVAFALHSLPLMLGTLFLMGAQSTLFGPVKYANRETSGRCLPALLPPALHRSARAATRLHPNAPASQLHAES